MNKFSAIDPILSEWARRHSVVWLTDYQGSQVRTFFLNQEGREKIQIWVDAPLNETTTVHAVQYRIGGKKKNLEKITCSITNLESSLDDIATLATSWLDC